MELGELRESLPYLVLGPTRIRHILHRALAASTADETEVTLTATEAALTRFADNAVHQNVAESDADLEVRAAFGRRVGTASGNDLSRLGIERVAAQACELARHQPENPEFPGLPEPSPLPETPVAEHPGEHPLYEAVRSVYGTQHVPVMFRALAARGLLEETWAGIGPYLASPAGRAQVARVRAAAQEEARRFPDAAFFRAERVRPVLEQFRIALPQNLVFVTAASDT